MEQTSLLLGTGIMPLLLLLLLLLMRGCELTARPLNMGLPLLPRLHLSVLNLQLHNVHMGSWCSRYLQHHVSRCRCWGVHTALWLYAAAESVSPELH